MTMDQTTRAPWRGGPIIGKSIRLRLAALDDAGFILDLRLDTSLNEFVSHVAADVEKQAQWLNDYKIREASGSEYYFIIEDLSRRPLGTVRIYDYQGDSFSWGSWMLIPSAPRNAAIESALLIYELAFGELGFNRAHFDVRKGNERVVAFHQRFGAYIVGETESDYFFEYSRKTYKAIRRRYEKFLPA
ncbi:N-acetyltransferase domain-containing protein [Bordetella sputigena]|uniref:GNAT family N-acetyltransferase n=1 Tax=Bordetella sputigena TaxID=1416810 RepID=UPI0039EE6549